MAEKLGRKAALFCSSFMLSVAVAVALSALSAGIDKKDQDKFADIAGILVPQDINASNHLYPYIASALTCGCILIVIMAIIIFGGGLGSEEE